MDPHFDGVIFQTHAEELARRLGRLHPRYCVIDVREAKDYRAGHIPGARNFSPALLTAGLPDGTDEATEFFVVGSAPGDPAVRRASTALRARGAHRVVEFQGGMSEWEAYGFDSLPEEEAA